MAATIKALYRGNDNTGLYYATGKRDMVRVDGGSTMPSSAAGPAGAFGNLLQTASAVNNIEWLCGVNGPVGKAGFTIGMSGNPNFTGLLSTARGGLFTIGCTRSQRGYWGGISIWIDNTSRVRVGMGSRANGGNYANGLQFSPQISFTQNTIKEIYVTWDGTTTANALKLWVCDRGNVPVNVASLTASAANTELWHIAAMASISNTNIADFVNTFQWDLEEWFILDEQVDVAAYFGNVARTAYLASPTGSAFEGYVPSASQIKIGEVVAGITGTYNGSDRWTSPDPADYLSTAPALKSNSLTANLTGTLVAESVDPGEDKVLLGHPYKILGVDKVGTLSHFRVDPDPGTSRITAGLQALKDALGTIFPSAEGWQYLVNPYRPEENPEAMLRLGYGIALGNGRSENLQICAQYDLNRAFTIVFTRKFEGTKSDAEGKEDVAVQLLEDQRELINALEQNPTLGGAIMYTQYQGDGGIEFVSGQKDNYLMLRTVLSFQYIENFV